MMTACGKNCDDRKEYTQSNLFMMKMRKDFAVVMEMFFAPSGAYEGHKAAGKTDSAIFEELVNAALTYDVYPVWADPYDSHKYKLFEMASFAFLVERRAAAMAKEIETKAPVMALIFSKIPELQSFYTPPKLKGDGVLLELPPGVDCTICHQVFHDQAGFVTHYNEHHLQATEKKEHVVVSPEQVEKVCPLCKIPLRQLEKGDWKCPGCKQVVNGEQINQPQEEE
jgi:ribosomal protein L37AE/L43A